LSRETRNSLEGGDDSAAHVHGASIVIIVIIVLFVLPLLPSNRSPSFSFLDISSTLAIFGVLVTEPFPTSHVKELVLALLRQGSLAFTKHALEEMKIDDLKFVDVRNILRAGVVSPGELERGTYRYRVSTSRIAAVIAFRSESHAVVVTAWRRHD
jgi:hypothetical protein